LLTTLKKRRHFLNAKNLGKSWATECFILQGVPHHAEFMKNSHESPVLTKRLIPTPSTLSCENMKADNQTPSSKHDLQQSSATLPSRHMRNPVEELSTSTTINYDSPSRIGYVATKKLGNAVVRNRAKRRLREACRLSLSAFRQEGMDYVLIAREKIINVPFDQLLRDLQWALKHLHRILDESSASSSE
jgi:ribonuclease P protein component